MLIHETKIPQKIELLSYMPGVDQPGYGGAALGVSQIMSTSSSDEVFQMLGHFDLDSNQHSQF